MRPAVIVPAVLAALLLGGCGDREPSEEEQVRETLTTFASAVEKKQYATLCEDVFAPELLDGLKEIGLPCEVAMKNSFADVRKPKIEVGAVSVKQQTATAKVKTTAEGQAASEDTVTLKLVKDQWRVSALGG